MNTFEFFRDTFGRHLHEQTNDVFRDAWRALSSAYKVRKKDGEMAPSRLQSGWAVLKKHRSICQINLDNPNIDQSNASRFEAFAAELENWDGEPKIFLVFDKAPIPISNVFMTVDLRAVRICSPKAIETFDYTATECPENAGVYQRNIFKERKKHAG